MFKVFALVTVTDCAERIAELSEFYAPEAWACEAQEQ